MNTAKILSLSGAALSALSSAIPALAQSNDAETGALPAEIAPLKAQLFKILPKVDRAVAAPAQLPTSTPAPAPEKADTKSEPEIDFNGAPALRTAEGWSFKPRGRVQVDVASVNSSATIAANGLGTTVRLRRAQLGFDGAMPGGFGYRVGADFAGGSADLTDIYLTYKASETLTITLGQHKPFWGFEEMTSDLFTSFNERAAYHGAFGFERRVGLSATYAGKNVQLQGGIFADNAADLNGDGTNNSRSFDGRIVFMPKLGDMQLHFGASGHSRRFNDFSSTARYRARPFTRTTDTRFVDTRSFLAKGEDSFGVEAFINDGRFHATAESHWLTARRIGAFADPTFNGGYAEIGYFLTKDSLAYKGGVVDRTKPSSPLGKGGMGAVQVNARYDWIDLSDDVIVGGKQQTYGLSLIWTPTEYLKFIANYGHLELSDAAVLAGGDRDYSADVFGMRAQIDF
jgi:phosphate-selective porin OprO/OprP